MCSNDHARLGPDALRRWSSGVNDAVGTAIVARPDGSFFVAGLTYGPAIFGAGEPGETTLQPSASSGLLFVARYTADGLLSWVRGSDGVALVGAGRARRSRTGGRETSSGARPG